MLRLCLLIIICFMFMNSVSAQTNYNHKPKTMVFAKGDDSYLFHSHKYDPSKKYIVLKVWNEDYGMTVAEKEQFDFLKQTLTNKNIEVVDFKWSDREDLISFMATYGLATSLKQNNCLSIKRGNSSLNTNSLKAVFILEEGRPTSLCSGKMCEENLKRFFGLIAID